MGNRCTQGLSSLLRALPAFDEPADDLTPEERDILRSIEVLEACKLRVEMLEERAPGDADLKRRAVIKIDADIKRMNCVLTLHQLQLIYGEADVAMSVDPEYKLRPSNVDLEQELEALVRPQAA